tara:strand:+ start:1144 stop:3123 length:1980 start_codon:yes stop_codon:yes gene_type:complete
MSKEKIEILERALKREKGARKVSEKILEHKSRDLYFLSQELKEANAKLANLLDQKSSQLQGVFENINDAYLVININGKVLKMNDVAIDFFGYNIDNESINAVDLIYVEDKPYAFKSFQKLIQDGFFTNYVARIITKRKLIKWVQINATIIHDKEKNPIAAQGIIRDITADKEAENLRIKSENRLSSLILNLDSGILLEDQNRQIVITNKMFCDIFRIPVSPNSLVGKDCSNASEEIKGLFKHPENFVERIDELLQNKKQVLGDELTMNDGTILERDFIPILIGTSYQGHLWAYRDVTLKRQYRKSLESQKEKYSSIIANMNLGLIEVNTKDEILMANQRFEQMSGYSEDELLGKKGKEIFPIASDQNIISEQFNNRLKGESNSYEIVISDKKGNYKNWLISGAPNYNLKGELIGSIGVHLDITEFRLLEKQKQKILKELEKSNNELQEYAHIVSHDLKTPLRSIDALVSWIKTDNHGKFDEGTLQNLELIEKTLETMESLISNILEYSSIANDIDKNVDVDLNITLEDVTRLLLIPEEISLELLKKLPVVKGDATKFQQIFQNLISNAIKFSNKEKGLIKIDYTETVSCYQFSVEDNGIGIEKKHYNKIFKIFYSLNESKESSGIGLSIVKKIVELYEGNIWIESTEGEGSKFYFTIRK